jgi:hypothetical protein
MNRASMAWREEGEGGRRIRVEPGVGRAGEGRENKSSNGIDSQLTDS